MVGIQDELTGPLVVSSDVVDTPRGPWARVVTRDPAEAGARLHAFPLEALEWRAAEYGIDPQEVDQLLDIVLHEPHVMEETVVHTAATVHVARAIHLGRIAAVKAAGTVVRAAPGADPLRPVRAAYAEFLDVGQVAEKRRYVEAHRVAVRAAAPRGWARRPIGGMYDMADQAARSDR